MRHPTDYDALMQKLDRESAERSARVRALVDEARPDLLSWYDARMRDTRLGLDGARNCWHSISQAQRRVLIAMRSGTALVRVGKWYEAQGLGGKVCRLPTARNLSARDLIAPDGGAFDPEQRFVLTERGQFVLRHGQTPAPL